MPTLTSYTTATLLLLGGVEALDNGLARVPQMGYNSWSCYATTATFAVAFLGPPVSNR